MNITKMTDLPAIKMACQVCRKTFSATIYSRAFSWVRELVCDTCGILVTIHTQDIGLRYFDARLGLHPYAERDAFGVAISQYLNPCPCGGSFSKFTNWVYDYYRCLHCRELLPSSYIAATLGLEGGKGGPLACSNIVVDGEEIDSTDPGLEIIGTVDDRDMWKRIPADAEWTETLNDRDSLYETIRFHAVKNPYGEFSNLSPHAIQIRGYTWPTVEHYYQAQKFAGTPYEHEIRRAKTAKEAAEMGRTRTVPIRRGWENVKVRVMTEALWVKIEQHPDIRKHLMETRLAALVMHTSHDAFWGNGGNGRGENKLGNILMDIRRELRARETARSGMD